MGKLIRDNIPELIEDSGKHCEYHVLTEEEYYKELKKKLLEETNEFLESDELLELADIYEVLLALLSISDIDMETFLEMRNQKAETNGKFEKRYYLDNIVE